MGFVLLAGFLSAPIIAFLDYQMTYKREAREHVGTTKKCPKASQSEQERKRILDEAGWL